MHLEAKNFTLFVKKFFGEHFSHKIVLDVGSGDINGNNRHLFENCTYEGNDVIEAKNVTIVSKTKDLPFGDGYFDTIISTECFEHDPEYKDSLTKIYRMLKEDGLFFFTCASTGRREHGTRTREPNSSYGTIGNIEGMVDYYQNLTERDLNDVLELDSLFSRWSTYYNAKSSDLYFVGIKKGKPREVSTMPAYEEKFVVDTSAKVN